MAKEMVIEKNISIDKPVNDVFNYLKLTGNQDNFSVWNMQDPNMKKTYSGTDGTKGFVYSWNSTNRSVGAGAQEITNIIEGNRIDYEIGFVRPMQNTGNSSFILNTMDENRTTVVWTFRCPTKFPMSLFAPIFRNMLGKQINQSLQNLKKLLEGK